MKHVVDRLNEHALVELDVSFIDLQETVRPALKYRSTLIRGTDVRDDLDVMTRTYWIRERLHAGYWLICHLFGRPGTARIPIPYPYPEGEFLGYNTHRTGAADGPEGSTKDLVRAVSWAATALVAKTTGDYVFDKSHLLAVVKKILPAPWSTFVGNLLEFCRITTNYLIPTESDGRANLKALCTKTREFEDYYLGSYRNYLLDELEGEPSSIAISLQAVSRTPFLDRELNDTVQILGQPQLTTGK